MKCSALNVDFNDVRLDPVGSRSPPYERIKFGYPLENVASRLQRSALACAASSPLNLLGTPVFPDRAPHIGLLSCSPLYLLS